MSHAATPAESSAWPQVGGFAFPIDIERKPLNREIRPAEGRLIPNGPFERKLSPEEFEKIELKYGSLVSGDTTEIFVPLLGWLQADEESNADGQVFALVIAYLFGVYAKAGGQEDAAFVIDGRPPIAMATPFARGMDTPFAEIVSEVASKLAESNAEGWGRRATGRSAAFSKASETDRQKIANELETVNNQEQLGTPLIGTTAVVLKSTFDQLGANVLMQAFDIIWVVDPNTVNNPNTGGEMVTTISLWYNHTIYSDISASNWMQLLRNIVAVEDINYKTLRDIDLVDEEMKYRLLEEWQPEVFPEEKYTMTACDMFDQQVKKYVADPKNTIAIYEPKIKRKVTYEEFDRLAWKFAYYLHIGPCKDSIHRFGIDATVALHLPRCADWYILMLGAFRAGAAYLSLDPDFPADRLNYIVQDADAMVLVTLESMKGTLSYTGPIITVDKLWEEVEKVQVPPNFKCPSTPHSPAYMIFTSGSTGKPKGCLIEHINLVSFVLSERALFKLDNKQRVIQGFSTSFDASLEEIWLAFASGSSLIVVEKQVMQDVDALSDLIIEYGATVLSTVPTLLATMEEDRMKQLKMVIVGGEACNKEVIDAWATPERIFVNSYGPTEATVACTAEYCSRGKPVTIGRAQPNYTAYILDENKNLLPPGVPGELIIGGPGVIRGYVNRPELTAEKFLSNPFHKQFHRMYCTGDLVRWTNEGKLEYLGRIDSQVKLRGFRIEVSEIENNLSTFPGVVTAIVCLRSETGIPYLCAYMICDKELQAKFSENAFRAHLKANLPTYMIPSRFVAVTEIPRSPAGKVDRKGFAPPPPAKKEEGEGGDGGQAKPFARPQTASETLVLEIWQKHLPDTGTPISCTDNFFEIGGQSLLAGKVSSALRKAGFDQCSIRYLYNNPTIQKLAAALDQMTHFARPEPATTQLPVRPVPNIAVQILFWVAQFILAIIALVATSGYIFLFLYVYGQSSWTTTMENAFGFSTQSEISNSFGAQIGRYLFEGFELGVIGAILVFAYMYTFIPLWKWALIQRVEEGTHSIWSFFFLRWWAVRVVIGILPIWYLQGTMWLNLFMKLMGAKVGRGVIYCAPGIPTDPDLVELGEDSWIGNETALITSEIIDHMLILRKVKIGACASVGARCAVRGGSIIGDGAIVRHLSLVQENAVIPDFELWGGSPAQKLGLAPTFSEVSKNVIRTDKSGSEGFSLSPSFSKNNTSGKQHQSFKSSSNNTRKSGSGSGDQERPLLDGNNNNDTHSDPGENYGLNRDSRIGGGNGDAMNTAPNKNSAMQESISHNGSQNFRLRAARPTTAGEVFLAIVYFLAFTIFSTIMVLPLFAIFVGIWHLVEKYKNDPRLGFLFLAFPVIILAFFLWIHVWIIILRWIVLPWNVKPGFYPCTGLMYHRKFLFDMLTRYSLVLCHAMYASIFIQYFLKAVGTDCGSRVEVSNLFGFTPGLVKLGDETFIADFIGVNPPEIYRGVLKLDFVEVEKRAFVGNGSVLPPGAKLCTRSLLGLMSYPDKEIGADTTHIGSPSFEIPRQAENKEGAAEAEMATYSPACYLVVARTIWEFFRTVMPASFISNSFIIAWLVCIQVYPILGEDLFNLRNFSIMYPFFVFISIVVNMLQMLIVKWVIVGKEHPSKYPLWSAGVWRGEFVVDHLVVLGGGGFMNFVRGTAIIPFMMRLLGAKIGSNCYIDTILFTEPDMVSIGDNCCIGDRVTIQTHLFEDRVMKIDTLQIDDRVSIGPLSVILYNTQIEKGCTVAPLSLVMKGENYPAGTHWAGIPAQRRAVPAVMALAPLAALPARSVAGQITARNVSSLSHSTRIKAGIKSSKTKATGGVKNKDKSKDKKKDGSRQKASQQEILALKSWLSRVEHVDTDNTTNSIVPMVANALAEDGGSQTELTETDHDSSAVPSYANANPSALPEI